MSNFHTTVNRRDFMKLLGVTGTGLGLGAAATINPTFHDFDEVISSPWGNVKKPWWVKAREFGDTSQEMDWSIYKRFDPDANGMTPSMIKRYGQEEFSKLQQLRSNIEAEHIANKTPGFDIRARAMYQNLHREGISSGFLGYQKSPTPESWGEKASPKITTSRWEGTPEENSKMMLAILKLRGASQVGFTELDDKSTRFIYAREGKKEYTFEDVDQAYENTTKRVVPNKCRYVISYAVPMSEELIRRMPSALAEGAVFMGYSLGRIVNSGISEYLRGIGYQGLGAGDNSFKVHPAFAIWTGIGEPSRMHQNMITPELGTSQRTFALVTDLPLAPTPPIEMGAHKYCFTCKKCAEACPGEALDKEESEPTWDTKFGDSNMAGQKAFPFSFTNCNTFWYNVSTGCGICMARCPYSHKNDGTIHDAVLGTIAVTPAFNGFFRKMDDVFGYGYEQDQNSWFDLPPRIYGMHSEWDRL